ERRLEDMRERRSDIELEHEKTIQRIERLQDQTKALEDRKLALVGERDHALKDFAKNKSEREAKSVQLSGLDEEKRHVEEDVAQASQSLSDCADRRNVEDRTIEVLRLRQFESVGREAKL